MEVDALAKTVALGSFASYAKGQNEIVGEAVAMNRKSVALEVTKSDRVSEKTLPEKKTQQSYKARPGAPDELQE